MEVRREPGDEVQLGPVVNKMANGDGADGWGPGDRFPWHRRGAAACFKKSRLVRWGSHCLLVLRHCEVLVAHVPRRQEGEGTEGVDEESVGEASDLDEDRRGKIRDEGAKLLHEG